MLNAFLNGDLEDEVFMEQPKGFVSTTNPNYLCRLKRALYGLKQSPCVWFQKLSSCLLQWGFQGSKADTLMFIFPNSNVHHILLIYMDDIIVIGNNIQAIDYLIGFFLGIEVFCDDHSLHLIQSNTLETFYTELTWMTENPSLLPCPRVVHSVSMMVNLFLILLNIEALLVLFNTAL